MPLDGSNTEVTFTLDGRDVTAQPGESIWQVAQREGTDIPHLCYAPEPGYAADGNCRACVVEVEGERTLAASCIRQPTEGMVVNTATERAESSRRMVFELLVADQPPRDQAHDGGSKFWQWADRLGVEDSRFPARLTPGPDISHPAMAVNFDACINCTLCVRACRDVQVNDVIGMAHRGADSKIVFDFDDPMGNSTCVACGECVQACPTGALLPATVIAPEGRVQPDRRVDSLCPYCGVGCQLTYNIKDDKLLFVEGRDGPSNHNRLCVKGRFGFDYIHHPHRMTKPLIRKEGVAKDPATQLNPANPLEYFREATWDEALDLAASGLKKVIDERGGNALAGFGSAKGSNEEAYLFQKLVRTGFHTNNVDHCTRLCHASSVAALMETVNSGAVSVPFNDCENSDVIIVIGANPTVNHPVAATFFKNAAKNGATLIVMDPRGQALSRHATHMLQFKGGSDVALLNALMHVIVEEGLTNENYIEDYTDCFYELKKHVKEFPPEKMAEICGIDAETLRDVARTFAGAKAAMIFWGMGVSQHIHGTDNSRCLISLALMTGQVGRPGSGLHPLRGQNNVQGASDAGMIPMFLPDYQSVTDDGVRSAFTEVWGSEDFSNEKGLTVTEIMDAVHDGEIHGMYILGENPAMSDPDVEHARDALAKLRHLVVQDIFITETANYADVILPASAFAEKSGTVTNTNRQVQMGRAAVSPPGEAREDWWIEVELAKRLGLNWTYTSPAQVFDEMALNMRSLDNITWDRLTVENAVTYPSLSAQDPGQAIVFGEGFPRNDGRAKFTPASLIAPDDVPDAEYPMILTTGRQLEHWHTGSMTRRSKVLDAVEPEANCSLHPKTLRALGVVAGGHVRLSTKRGSIVVMARADRSVSEDMVFLPFAYVEAAANILTNSAVDPYGKIPEFKFSAVKVEAADGSKIAAE